MYPKEWSRGEGWEVAIHGTYSMKSVPGRRAELGRIIAIVMREWSEDAVDRGRPPHMFAAGPGNVFFFSRSLSLTPLIEGRPGGNKH